MTGLLLAFWVGSTAHAWPGEPDWAAICGGGVPMVDDALDQEGGGSEDASDLVGDSARPLAYWYYDGLNVYFRVRVNAVPTGGNGCWRFAFDTAGSTNDFEYSVDVVTNTLSEDIAAWYFMKNGTSDGIDAVPGTQLDTEVSPDVTSARFVESSATDFGTSDDGFLDILLQDTSNGFQRVSPTHTSAFRVAIGGTTHSNCLPFTDLSGPNDVAGLGDLSDGLSDDLYLDQDGDTLDYFTELDQGTDPARADTDGDGLDDNVEIEAGFNPVDEDTDGDGVDDKAENECQLSGGSATDRDNDGIPDGVEGQGDVDDDGYGNFCDTDSDGDGESDREEGVDDDDCDGVPNYLDDDDEDGSCDTDSDADTDADADTDTDTSGGVDTSSRADTGRPGARDGGLYIGCGRCSSIPLSPTPWALLLLAATVAGARRR